MIIPEQKSNKDEVGYSKVVTQLSSVDLFRNGLSKQKKWIFLSLSLVIFVLLMTIFFSDYNVAHHWIELLVHTLLGLRTQPTIDMLITQQNHTVSDICTNGVPGLRVNLNLSSTCVGIKVYLLLTHQHDEETNVNHFFRETIMPISTWLSSCFHDKQKICYFFQSSLNYFRNSSQQSKKPGHNLFFNAMKSETCHKEIFIDQKITVSNFMAKSPVQLCSVHITNHHVKVAAERYLIGSTKEQRLKSFENIKSGASKLMNKISLLDHNANNKRTIIIYTREDGAFGRRLLNGDEISSLLQHNFPNMRVILVRNLLGDNNTNTSNNYAYNLFREASIFIGPHGGWMPNILFTKTNSLILVIERQPEVVLTFKSWDYFFTIDPNITINLLTSVTTNDLHSSVDREMAKYFIPTEIQLTRRSDVYLKNISNVIRKIKDHSTYHDWDV